MRIMFRTLAVASFAVSVGLTGFGQTIAGTVTASGGAVAGASVLYHNLVPMQAVQSGPTTRLVPGQRVGGSVTTSANGEFSTPALPPGDYVVCVYPADPHFISNCEWNAKPTLVTVGSSTVLNDISLRAGTVLHLTTADPNGRLAADPKYAVSVINASGMLATARRDSAGASSAAALLHSVTVPQGEDVFLFIDTDWDVLDDHGQPVVTKAPGLRIPGSTETDVIAHLTLE